MQTRQLLICTDVGSDFGSIRRTQRKPHYGALKDVIDDRAWHTATLIVGRIHGTTSYDAFGDVSSAAARLDIHSNTLRYRLKRIDEIIELDLTEPLTRFVLELQWRLR